MAPFLQKPSAESSFKSPNRFVFCSPTLSQSWEPGSGLRESGNQPKSLLCVGAARALIPSPPFETVWLVASSFTRFVRRAPFGGTDGGKKGLHRPGRAWRCSYLRALHRAAFIRQRMCRFQTTFCLRCRVSLSLALPFQLLQEPQSPKCLGNGM